MKGSLKELMNKNWIVYSLLIMISILINVYSFNKYYSVTKQLSPDETLYQNIAKSILENKSYILENNHPVDIGTEVTPGYPGFIAGLYYLLGINTLNVFLIQVILNILVILILYRLMVQFISKPLAFFTAIWLALYWPLWRMNFNILMEVTTVFCLIVSLLFLLRFFKGENILLNLVLFCILFSLLIFINNRFIVHFFMLHIPILFYLFKNHKNRILYIFIPLLILFSVMLPWNIRQYSIYKQPVCFTPTWNNLLNRTIGIFPKINIKTDLDEIPTKPGVKSYEQYLSNIKEIRKSAGESVKNNAINEFTPELYNKLTKDYNEAKPIDLYISRLHYFWSIAEFNYHFVSPLDSRLVLPSTRIRKLTGLIFLLPMFLLMPVGIYFAFRNKNYFFQVLFLIVFAHCCLHVMIHYISRYRLTIIPIIFMLGWYGAQELLLVIQKKER